MSSEDANEVTIRIQISSLWNVRPCNPVENTNVQEQPAPPSSTLHTVAGFSETSVNFYQDAGCHVPADSVLQSHSLRNLKISHRSRH